MPGPFSKVPAGEIGSARLAAVGSAMLKPAAFGSAAPQLLLSVQQAAARSVPFGKVEARSFQLCRVDARLFQVALLELAAFGSARLEPAAFRSAAQELAAF